MKVSDIPAHKWKLASGRLLVSFTCRHCGEKRGFETVAVPDGYDQDDCACLVCLQRAHPERAKHLGVTKFLEDGGHLKPDVQEVLKMKAQWGCS